MLAAHKLGMTKGEWAFLDVELVQVSNMFTNNSFVIEQFFFFFCGRQTLIRVIENAIERIVWKRKFNVSVDTGCTRPIVFFLLSYPLVYTY